VLSEIDISDNLFLLVYHLEIVQIVAVQIYDPFGDCVVNDFVTLVEHDKEQIESRHDGRGQLHVLLQ